MANVPLIATALVGAGLATAAVIASQPTTAADSLNAAGRSSQDAAHNVVSAGQKIPGEAADTTRGVFRAGQDAAHSAAESLRRNLPGGP